MQSTAAPPSHPTLSQGAALWSELSSALTQRNALDARIVELTSELVRTGTIEELEGLPIDIVLSLTHRLPRADRAMLLTACDVLRSMPATLQLFKTGVLSWGLVRGIVAEARRLNADERAALDDRIAASEDRFTKLDPDDALDAVAVAAHELYDPRSIERAEARAEAGNFFWAQAGLFGRGKMYSELDNISLASVVNRVDVETPADDGRSLAQRRADGLVAMALHRCCTGENCSCQQEAVDVEGAEDSPEGKAPVEGAEGAEHRVVTCGGTKADPSISVIVDTSQVSINAAGVIEVNAPGCLPTLSARLVEALAGDATVRAVLFDGGRPLAVTKQVRARDVPPATRLAVKLRDGGDRFPGSRGPAGQSHLHHFDKEGEGHHPDHILTLMPASHRRVHRHGWRVRLDPRTGEATFTRGERAWTTLPRRTRLRRSPPAGGNDPPAHETA